MQLVCLINSGRCFFYKVVGERKICVSVESYPRICENKNSFLQMRIVSLRVVFRSAIDGSF